MVCCFLPITLTIICICVYYILRFLYELPTIDGLSARAVFITGCDSGFGRMLAVKCVVHRMHVFAGCLTEKGMKLVEAEGSMVKGGSLCAVLIDITKDDSVKQAAEFVKQQMKPGIKLWAIVNNAGVFTTYGPDDWCCVQDYKFSFDVNTLGHIRVSQAFKPLLKQSKGRIVTVTSIAGRVAIPYAGPYSAAKFATEAYMDCIRQELKPFGVTCCIVEPGVFKTTIVDRMVMKQRIEGLWEKLTDEQKNEYGEDFKNFFAVHWSETFNNLASTRTSCVVDSYYHALTARFPRYRYRCGWDAILLYIPITYLSTAAVDFILRFLLGPKVRPAATEKAKSE
ncbi:Short-chain dehydrogenase/reductase family 9C member 7 [Toxocara canis]|uniref:Short-chain dehydrogenase/reductase family 9C member 7 n=1 Tax=Toxocara canis TaxID=6265 RepID=A0A0B2V4P8_TOXCA|nr:Short-chain dehydrogenase/reductase family 9C member 7 [Toxocara canis]